MTRWLTSAVLLTATVRTNSSGTASTERLTYRDAAGVAPDTEVLTWETLRLDMLKKVRAATHASMATEPPATRHRAATGNQLAVSLTALVALRVVFDGAR